MMHDEMMNEEMMNDEPMTEEEYRKTTYGSVWEMVEHGWRAVVSEIPASTQYSAFIKYVGAPYWRVWAGQMFDTVEEAQVWCREEIALQLKQAGIEVPEKPWHAEPPAWRWLWETLSEKLGEADTLAIRTELADRLSVQEQKMS
jgi:hypothetical protein